MPFKDPERYKEYQREYQRSAQAKRRAAMAERKLARGCDVCGYNKHHAALHWHHRDPIDKVQQVSWLLSAAPARLEAEIAKCDLLCANCHAEKENP